MLQDEEYSEQEYQAVEKHDQEQETTTTEAPKRITLAVRPFRSNDDLLAALKKRRLQAKSQQQQQPKTGKFIFENRCKVTTLKTCKTHKKNNDYLEKINSN